MIFVPSGCPLSLDSSHFNAKATQLLNASASAILEVDVNGIVLFASSALTSLFGYTADELRGKTIETLIPMDKRAGHKHYFKAFVEQGHNRSMGMGNSFPGRHKSGQIVYVSIGLALIHSEAGQASIVVTITESVRLQETQKSLRDSEIATSNKITENKRLLEMANNSQNIVLLVNPDLTVSWANTALVKILGYALHEVKGKHPLFFIHKKTNENEALTINKALEQQLNYSGKLQLARKSGSAMWANVSLYPNFENQHLLGFVIHINDIDHEQVLMAQVSRHKETLEATARIANLGTWELDVVTNELYWSDEVYAIHELPVGTPMKVENGINFYAPEARPVVSKLIEDSIATGKQWDFELPLITAKNNRLWVRAVGYVEYADGEPVRLKGAFQDITTLKNAVEASDAANKAKSVFLANMSHEIRTPINGVLGMNDLLLSTELNDVQYKYASVVKQSAQTLLHLVNEVLDYSKMEAGKLQVINSAFDIKEMVTERVQWHIHNASQNDVEFSLNIDNSVPQIIAADEHRIAQVLNNLCSNAVKFTHSGRIILSVSVREGQGIHFVVNDTGIGIEESQLNTVFEEFEQSDNSFTREYSGTGLGLSISKRLVVLMGGEIGVQSKIGRGSSFWFSVPFELHADVEADSLADLQSSDGPSLLSTSLGKNELTNLHILIAEDNEINRVVFTEMLKKKGVVLTLAENGADALRIAKAEGPFDVILMDCQMPLMDGFEATRLIRQLDDDALAKQTIIAATAHGMDDELKACLDAGMDDYLVKPFTQDQLTSVLLRNL